MSFIKPLTNEELKKHQASIDAYNVREQARGGNVPENPLTGEELRRIAEDNDTAEESDEASRPNNK